MNKLFLCGILAASLFASEPTTASEQTISSVDASVKYIQENSKTVSEFYNDFLPLAIMKAIEENDMIKCQELADSIAKANIPFQYDLMALNKKVGAKTTECIGRFAFLELDYKEKNSNY